LVQHGDKERVPGDPGLTELGRQQAQVTARWLQGIGVDEVYSSSLRRARETAEAIARAAGLTVRLDDRLRERMNWDGAQVFDDFRAEWDRSAKDRDFVPGSGESSRLAGERLREFLAAHSGGSGQMVAVTHGGVTTDLLRTLLGDDRLPPRLLGGIPPCAITTCDDHHVVTVASTGHLAP
jgi:broad specificity phosphatase PhoE